MMNGIRREISKLEKEKAKAQLSSDLKKEAELCNELGQLYAENENYEAALKEHQQELQLCESSGDVVGSAIAHRKIGECHLEMGCFPKAIRHHQKHHSLAKSADSHVEQQRALTTIGRTYFCQAETLDDGEEKLAALEKAKTAYLGSMSVCQNHLQGVVSTREYHEMRARIFLNLGLVYDCQNDFTGSVKFIQQAIKISQQNRLHEDLVRCQIPLAEIYRCAGEFPNSLQCLGKALKVAMEMKNKEQQREILRLQGTVHFHSGDFLTAKKLLKKAHKMAASSDAERGKLKRPLKAAIKCCKLEEEIEEATQEGDQKRVLNLEEQVGDICCKMTSYGLAIQHYKKQLGCAKALHVPPPQLIPIYVSLAQTYSDNKQYSSEVEMYREELKLRTGNPKEECKTWLNVAYAQEQSGQDYDVLQQSYHKALECAVTAGLPKLQLQALTSLRLVQEVFKEEEALNQTNKKLSRLKADHDLKSDDEESEEDEGSKEETDVLDTEELDLSDSDESEAEQQQEEFDRPLASRRAQRAKFDKRNEKGETLLHRACIDGNLKQVKSLLQQGHPVNPRDYCGWLPLHEACNHDHLAVVEALLEHGAAISDRGGPQCGGITPLHDALSCGNLEVAELLVRKGASVIAKDDKGLAPLDTLKNWEESCWEDLDTETRERCYQLRQLMVDATKGTDATVQPVPSVAVEKDLLDSDLYDDEESSQSQRVTGTLSQYQTGALSQVERQTSRMSSQSGQDRGSRAQRGGSLRNQRDASSGSESDGHEDNPWTASDGLPLIRSHPRKHQTDNSSKKAPSTGGGNGAQSCERLTHEDNNVDDTSRRIASSRSPLGTNCTSEGSSGGGARNHKELKEDASSVYRNAMASIGSSAASRATGRKYSSSPSSRPSSSRASISRKVSDSLIAEDHYVADDWLVEDMLPTKRRRLDGDVFRDVKSSMPGANTESNEMFGGGRASPVHSHGTSRVVGTRETSWPNRDEWAVDDVALHEGLDVTKDANGDRVANGDAVGKHDWPLAGQTAPPAASSGNRSSKLARRKKKQTQLKLTGIVSQRPRSPADQSHTEGDHQEVVGSPPRAGPPPRPSQEIAHPTMIQSPPSAPASTLRVKVRVEGKVFLISVPLSSPKTIKWLSEETQKRYYAFSGLRPQLSLTTADSALFSPEDIVSEILTNNEEILATVESWELPPLHERYKTQCEKESHGEHLEIRTRIESLESHNLDLSRLTLRDRHLRPLLSSLQCQYSLRRLMLSRNKLSDATVGCLGDVMASLPNLCHLDLSCNEVSHEGLRRISDALLKEPSSTMGPGAAGQRLQKPLQHLEGLFLDYNPLSDSSALYIANIVKHCPLLSELSLSSADLTSRFFQLHRTALIEAFQGASYLDSMNISHNALGSTGVKLMLKCLKADKISRLDIASVIDKPGDHSLAKHLADYYSKQNCSLQRLSLQDCRLDNASMAFLSKCIPQVPSTSWARLNLSTNPRITQEGVLTLLTSLKKQGCGLGSLDLSGCSLVSPLEGGVFDLLAGFMASDHPSGETLTELVLSGNKLNRNDLEVLISVWEAVHGESASHCIDSVRCTLSAS